eukprot:jgi/Botrbrau1/1798/Bobra.0217s0049.1
MALVSGRQKFGACRKHNVQLASPESRRTSEIILSRMAFLAVLWMVTCLGLVDGGSAEDRELLQIESGSSEIRQAAAPAPTERAQRALDIPQPPYLFTLQSSYLFFSLFAMKGENQLVPDPEVKFLNVGPASLTITRYSSSPFGGAFDQIDYSPGFASYKNYSFILRPSVLWASPGGAVTADPRFPLAWPTKIADFNWTTRADGRQDLVLYSPPGSGKKVGEVRGLYLVPGLAIPVPNTTTFLPESLNALSDLNSIVDSYDNPGPIQGHVKLDLSISGTATIATLESFHFSESPLATADPFFPVGLGLLDGSKWFIKTTRV